MTIITALPSFIARLLIDFYRAVISPVFTPSCKFHPTCSGYAREAFSRHGLFKGLALSMWRILRCQPWSGNHWHDPVPKRFAWKDILVYKRINKDEHE